MRNLEKDKYLEVKHEDTFGIGDDFMISKIKIGKTTFIVSSYFEKEKPFTETMEKIIKHKIKTS